MPTTIMRIFTNSPDTIAAGSQYLRVISFSFVFMGFSQVFITAGLAIFIKSLNRIPDFEKKYFILNLTSELFNE